MPESPSWERFVNPAFAQSTRLAERHREQRRSEAASSRDARNGHAAALLSGRVPQSFEVLDRAASTYGIEPRYPFWDKRLVEFCVSLPAEAKLKAGWSRHVLRRAMEGILPTAVQWRRDKLDFGPHIIRGMLKHHGAMIGSVLDDKDGTLGGYVDLPGLRAAYQRISDQAETADGRDVKALWRTVVLATGLTGTRAASSTAVAA
jgi:asparagine synthase (glutamine-hydrolysing)